MAGYTDALTDQMHDLGKRIADILQGHDPHLQGAVLADLVALFFAGQQAGEFRDERLQAWIKMMRALIPLNELLVRGPLGAEAKH